MLLASLSFGAFAGSPSAPSNCAATLQSLPLSAEEYGRVIGIAPLNSMDQEFRDIFGTFLFTHHANEAPLVTLAEEIFQKRFALAQKHKTRFVSSVEARSESGDIISLWKTRLEGRSENPVWSFGFKNHERADEIWQTLNERLDPASADKIQVNEPFGKGMASVWSFNYDSLAAGPSLRFKIFGFQEASGFSYFISHPESRLVPLILQKLTTLWQSSLNPLSPASLRIETLAEFEWLWFWTNPFGRAGATIGRALSLLAQKAMIAEGLSLRRPKKFYPEDLEALSQSLPHYTSWRLQVLKGPGF